MAVVVTGGAGFVGSHLVEACIARGEHVVIIDNLLTGKRSNIVRSLDSGDATLVQQDVGVSTRSHVESAIQAVTSERITKIFHLASPASPEAYNAHPWATLAVNGTGTMSLIDLAVAHGAQLLFTSTSEVYGDPIVHPQPETYFGNVNPVGPRACYDEGKRFGEAAMSVAVRTRGLDGRVVRIFNCYGPRMDIGDGRLIPALFEAARTKTPFAMHGTGLQTRSMTYVDDLVRGILAVSNWKTADFRPVNLGRAEEHTVQDVVRTFVEVTGLPIEIVTRPGRSEDPQRRLPVTTLAESIGWIATTSLAEGLLKTYDWFARQSLLTA